MEAGLSIQGIVSLYPRIYGSYLVSSRHLATLTHPGSPAAAAESKTREAITPALEQNLIRRKGCGASCLGPQPAEPPHHLAGGRRLPRCSLMRCVFGSRWIHLFTVRLVYLVFTRETRCVIFHKLPTTACVHVLLELGRRSGSKILQAVFPSIGTAVSRARRASDASPTGRSCVFILR